MKEKIALFSVLANFVLAVIKIIGGFFINSASVLAEGLHSGMDIFSSIISFAGIRIAKKPVDENHPYGHYKFEVLGGLVITIILFLTGAWIIFEAYQSFLKPISLKFTYWGLGIMLFSAIVNEVMSRIKIYFGKKEDSVSLLSDGMHSRVDVFSSTAVFIGLFFSKYWIYTDYLLAIFIGFYIIIKSFQIGKEAIDSLLDISAGKEIEEKIKSIAKTENIEISSLKTQKKGSAITANLEIKLPSNLSVDKATKISEDLRKKLMKEIEPLFYVAIQIKSHEMETSFYKPGFGRGFGWQRRGRFRGEVETAVGGGPGGYCVCPNCGYKVEHQRGIPCSSLQCPKCRINLIRK
jgi:cation diffusion facilitator family transporter